MTERFIGVSPIGDTIITHDVLVSYGDQDWFDLYHSIEGWLAVHYPGLRKLYLGNEDRPWDWGLTFLDGVARFSFRDPKVAMLFKLAWGGE